MLDFYARRNVRRSILLKPDQHLQLIKYDRTPNEKIVIRRNLNRLTGITAIERKIKIKESN